MKTQTHVDIVMSKLGTSLSYVDVIMPKFGKNYKHVFDIIMTTLGTIPDSKIRSKIKVKFYVTRY